MLAVLSCRDAAEALLGAATGPWVVVAERTLVHDGALDQVVHFALAVPPAIFPVTLIDHEYAPVAKFGAPMLAVSVRQSISNLAFIATTRSLLIFNRFGRSSPVGQGCESNQRQQDQSTHGSLP